MIDSKQTDRYLHIFPEAVKIYSDTSDQVRFDLPWMSERLKSLDLNIPRIRSLGMYRLSAGHLTHLDIKAPSLEVIEVDSLHTLQSLTELKLYLPSLAEIKEHRPLNSKALMLVELYLPMCKSSLKLGQGVKILEYTVLGEDIIHRYDERMYRYDRRLLDDDTIFIEAGYKLPTYRWLKEKEMNRRYKLMLDQEREFKGIDDDYNDISSDESYESFSVESES
jgi:hypothetical protein